MPTAWPPASFTWPPPQFPGGCEFYDVAALTALQDAGFTQAAPTAQENNNIFKTVRCDLGHPVVGRMLVGPDGARYPFAVCNTNHDAAAGLLSRAVFFLWAPFYRNDFDRG